PRITSAASSPDDTPSIFGLGRQRLGYGTVGASSGAGRMGQRRLRAGLCCVHASLRGVGWGTRVDAAELALTATSGELLPGQSRRSPLCAMAGGRGPQ